MIASGPVADVESIMGGGASVAGNARVVLRVCSAPVRDSGGVTERYNEYRRRE